ncbi:MAG: DoxX protein [Verrucomicrobiales bacterium]
MNQKAELFVRYLLALILTVFGLNTFIGFMENPTPPEEGGKFLMALGGAGYIYPAVAIVFLIAAVCLWTKRCVGFALVLLAPMTVNIFLYHLRFDIPGIGAGALIAILQVALAAMHRASFQSLCGRSQG